MRKRILLIVLILLIGLGAWYVYKKRVANGGTTDSALFPTGKDVIPNTGTLGSNPIDGSTNGDQNSGTLSTTEDYGAFKLLTSRPVAGYTSFYTPITVLVPADPNNPKSKATTKIVSKHFIRYVSRGNGYVYEFADDTTPLQITNIYIPNIYEALFADNNQTAILRFLRSDQQTIATFSVPIPGENKDGTRTQKEGVYLPDNITSIATSPDGKQLARLLRSGGLSTITTTTSTNTKRAEFISSQLKEWLISWPTTKALYLQTKPSYLAQGYFYQIDQTNKRLRRVLGGINGLTTSLSPSGDYLIYSESTNSSFSTKILNLKTNTTKSLNLSLLPEKCTWLANDDLICAGNSSVATSNYPDDWYMGTTKLSDQLYHIYTANNIFDVLYNNSGKSFDMTNLSVDQGSNTVYFIDKTTGLLWKMAY